ncbi:leucyl/phenylalanyl-tRNA--protein transferase [Roseobacter litoralis]|uniref:Leucyl/phenylalanyl-tRNA--protein transferase n=1 Tax=Roseobacter litoralis (strain ATCC 49566 / DSM 6996 / JCM 21268 / NBRC 15278 / OCh 149) TaxID=391595 RepID=F7ZGT3_ROSLO|nr:leucyl/phenylalanyl-tRNA--protein transferase [Roseobacter litoralis]AEI93584.1 leucyl/phenylalanyl-tRNA--protein transferase Aat [Roseobacter litoralis Och 149]
MRLTPDVLMQAYATGIFPMAEHRDDPDIFWVDPLRRGVMPLREFHVSRSLRRQMLRTGFEIRVDQDFAGVVDGCADRADTWINDEIRSLYNALHERDQAHSLEVWEEDTLVGGVYGVTLGAAFFGESMFSRRTNASKIALACLVDRLLDGGFALFDTQFLTDHLASLGAIEISRAEYQKALQSACARPASFVNPPLRTPQEVVQRITQMS